jgi:hypothetical protein
MLADKSGEQNAARSRPLTAWPPDTGETMNRRNARNSLASFATLSILMTFAPTAHADVVVSTPLPVAEPVTVTASSPEAVAETVIIPTITKTVPWYQTNGAAAIAKRQITLSGLTTKLSTQTKDCGTNAAMQAEIARTGTSLTTLGAALASTTDAAAAKNFYRQIFTEHRVYALVAPKANKVERCDTQLVRNEALAAEALRLQGLIDKAKAEGINVTVAQLAKDSAVATLAGVNPTPSQATIISLVPDRGNKTLLAANTAALRASDAQLDATLLQQRTVNTQLDAVRAALRQDLKVDRAQDKINAKLAADARRSAALAERAAKKAAAAAAREAQRVTASPTPVVAA